ncbi:hypothetical protein [Roseburia faecis]|nr:hypothetical protein [Roseburia faecis]
MNCSLTGGILLKRKYGIGAEKMVRYDKIFSIIDIKEENMKKWGEVLPFYKNVQKEGVILWKAA